MCGCSFCTRIFFVKNAGNIKKEPAGFKLLRRCLPISAKEYVTNDDIRVREVRLVGLEGEPLGIMKLDDAKEYAYSRGVDLVLIAPQAAPPVCRAMDYGKYRFEQEKKEKEARKKQQIIKIKEVKLSCRIDTHDFETRVKSAQKFLLEGDKVKVIVVFKGREMAHQEIGREMIKRFEEACSEYGASDKRAVMEGRFMSVMLSPVKTDAKDKNAAAKDKIKSVTPGNPASTDK